MKVADSDILSQWGINLMHAQLLEAVFEDWIWCLTLALLRFGVVVHDALLAQKVVQNFFS